MTIILSVLSLLGGLAMFLYGMEVMSEGLKNASGATLKKVLEKVTSNVVVGVLMGTIVTAVIQSSTATIVITVGLITAGILNLKQAVSIVLGANIGTTVTAQIIRLMDIDSSGNLILNFLKPDTLAPIALIVGIIFIMFVKTKNSKALGEIFAGFGILFIGIMNMTDAVAPLTESDMFANIISYFADMPLLGILTGFITTIIAQSSSAMVGVLQALSQTGIMTFDVVYPIIMGINLGTCVTTAIICAIGSSKDAKRTGAAHIIFNAVGTILFMIAMTIIKALGGLSTLWPKIVDSGDIANFQTIFNLVTAIVLVPFTGLLVKLTYVIIKPDEEIKVKDDYAALHTLSEKLYGIPQMAISEATTAIGVMGHMAHDNFKKSIAQLQNYSDEITVGINTREEKIDEFTDTAENFLVALSRNTLSEEQSEIINMLIQTSTDFERIGDYATNINEFAEKIHKEQIKFSKTAVDELKLIFSAVNEITEMAVTAFAEDDEELAKRVEPLEEVIDDMVQYLRENHINRLKAGKCTINAGLLFIETLTYLERASDQCSSIAMMILSKHDPAIRRNHHEYIHELHKEKEGLYANELRTRRAQYLDTLYSLE